MNSEENTGHEQGSGDGYINGYILKEISIDDLQHLVTALMQPPFTFRGEQYFYGAQGWSERCVEVPIGYRFVQRQWGKRILEVGNVLTHHHLHLPPTGYHILDKYEKSPGVINEDIVDHRTPEPYDALLSISTLEHVGNWNGDEQGTASEVPEAGKVGRALANMVRLVRPGGDMMISMPWGANSELDTLLLAVRGFEKRCMTKSGPVYAWEEHRFEDAQKPDPRDATPDKPNAKAGRSVSVIFLLRDGLR